MRKVIPGAIAAMILAAAFALTAYAAQSGPDENGMMNPEDFTGKPMPQNAEVAPAPPETMSKLPDDDILRHANHDPLRAAMPQEEREQRTRAMFGDNPTFFTSTARRAADNLNNPDLPQDETADAAAAAEQKPQTLSKVLGASITLAVIIFIGYLIYRIKTAPLTKPVVARMPGGAFDLDAHLAALDNFNKQSAAARDKNRNRNQGK